MSAANDSKAHDAEVKAPEFVPPAHIEELFAKASGNKWSSINRPTAGPRQEQELPRGSASFQLYSLGTPNGFKVGIILEELDIDYDAHVINIGKGDQFGSGFVEVSVLVVIRRCFMRPSLIRSIPTQRSLQLSTTMVRMAKQ